MQPDRGPSAARMTDGDSDLVRRLCQAAMQASNGREYRMRALDLLRVNLAFDAALFHELSPRVPLSRAAVWGLDVDVLTANSAGWDETAVRLQPMLEVALAGAGAATDSEAFPRGSRSRREWDKRVAKPLGIAGLLVGHLLRHGRIVSAVLLMRRRRSFTLGERVWLEELLPCLTLGDSYWQFAGQRRYAGMLVQPVCRDQRLTPRQRQVVEGVALGRTNRQIAESLGISANTVRNLLAAVFERLGAGNRADVVRLAALGSAYSYG